MFSLLIDRYRLAIAKIRHGVPTDFRPPTKLSVHVFAVVCVVCRVPGSGSRWPCNKGPPFTVRSASCSAVGERDVLPDAFATLETLLRPLNLGERGGDFKAREGEGCQPSLVITPTSS